MGRVVVLGSLNVDLVTHVERHPEPGETVLGEGLQRLLRDEHWTYTETRKRVVA